MSKLILHTSGTTKEPKEISYAWEDIKRFALNSITEVKLTKDDVVLDVFPGNTIAHYTVTAIPAQYAGAKLITANFDPYSYIKLFNKYQPTYISLVPRHWEILSKTKGWDNFDMSSVRYMVVGSGLCSQEMIDSFRARGVKLVANWYGMTEMPPPVFVGYNSEAFDFTPKDGYTVEFTDEGECVINGHYTNDIFDVTTKKFLQRKLMQITVPGKPNLVFRLLEEADYPSLQKFCDHFKEQGLKNNDSFESIKLDKMKMPYGQYFIGYDTDKDCIWNLLGVHHLPEVHEHAWRVFFRGHSFLGIALERGLTLDIFKLGYQISYMIGMQIEFVLAHDPKAEIFASTNTPNAETFARSQFIDQKIAPMLVERGVFTKAYEEFELFNTKQSIWKFNVDRYFEERKKSVGF